MDPIKGILVKTFGNVADADLAAGQLRGHGIECVIKTDDCAGMYPSMGVIQLLVNADMVEDARKVLNESSPATTASTSSPDATLPVLRKPMPRVLRFNFGLLVGIVVGVLVHISYSELWKLRDITTRYDFDKDGVNDAVEIWKNGELREGRMDRNGNGRIDYWVYYRNGQPFQDESDDNFDGKADGSFTYSPRRLYSSSVYDTDHNGVPDVTTIFTNGVVKQADWRPNGTNVVLLRQLFRHGVLDEELRDLNGDGLFDVSIKYDRFNTPIRTNNLRATTQSP
jgi:hypothetical protein